MPWVILWIDEASTPSFIFKVVEWSASRLACTAYRLFQGSGSPLYVDARYRISLGRADSIKACVSDVSDAKYRLPIFIYCGNYKRSKLLLSRFHWKVEGKALGFFVMQVKTIIECNAQFNDEYYTIPAIARCKKSIDIPLSKYWSAIIHYLHDDSSIQNNKTQKKLGYTKFTLATCQTDESLVHQIFRLYVASAMLWKMKCTALFCATMLMTHGISQFHLSHSTSLTWIKNLTKFEFSFGFNFQSNVSRYLTTNFVESNLKTSTMLKLFAWFGMDVAKNYMTMRCLTQ